MILPDVNILIHAHNSDSDLHEKAREWWDRALTGNEGVGLAWVTVLGFIRLTTHPVIARNPLTPGDACSRIAEWMELPHLHFVSETENHFDLLHRLLLGVGTAGNLTTDAQLAAIALSRGYTLYSCDNNFARFPGLRWKNPLK